MKTLFLFLSITFSIAVEADVFKCISPSGKIAYQDKPCTPDRRQEYIYIEPIDPRELAEAEKRLKAWQIEYEERRAAELEAERQRREDQARLDAVKALEQSAEAQRRQAEALENQYRAPAYPSFYIPYHQTKPPSRGRRRDAKDPSRRTTRDPAADRTDRFRRR